MPSISFQFDLKTYIYIALVVIFLGGGFYINSLSNDIVLLKKDIATKDATIEIKNGQITALAAAVDRQSEAIKQNALDTKASIDKLAETAPKIIEKYSTIKVKDDSCQAKLDAMNATLDLFYKGTK